MCQRDNELLATSERQAGAGTAGKREEGTVAPSICGAKIETLSFKLFLPQDSRHLHGAVCATG